MRRDYQGKSSNDFISRLSKLERMLFESFTSHQRADTLGTFCVFQSAFSSNFHFMGVPSDSPLAAHIDWNMEQDNNRYNILLMALDLDRSFESQWPYAPGRYDSLDGFVNQPLICARGLDQSRFVDAKKAIGDGMRRSFMKLVSSTDEPAAPSPVQKPKPQFTLHQGFRP